MVSHHSNRHFCQICDAEENFQLDYIESFESRARRRWKKSRSQSHKKNVKIINPILISILLPQLAFIQRNFVHPLLAGFVQRFCVDVQGLWLHSTKWGPRLVNAESSCMRVCLLVKRDHYQKICPRMETVPERTPLKLFWIIFCLAPTW